MIRKTAKFVIDFILVPAGVYFLFQFGVGFVEGFKSETKRNRNDHVDIK